MQVTIARQLGLEPSTVGNFFMNARRRSMDKWKDDNEVVTSTTPNAKVIQMSGGPPTPTGLSNAPQMMIQQSPSSGVTTTVVHMPHMGQGGMVQNQLQGSMVSGHCLDEQDLWQPTTQLVYLAPQWSKYQSVPAWDGLYFCLILVASDQYRRPVSDQYRRTEHEQSCCCGGLFWVICHYTQRNLCSNSNYIFPDWFSTKWNPVWCQIYRKSLITIIREGISSETGCHQWLSPVCWKPQRSLLFFCTDCLWIFRGSCYVQVISEYVQVFIFIYNCDYSTDFGSSRSYLLLFD